MFGNVPACRDQRVTVHNVGTREPDSVSGRSRTDRQSHRLTGVKANAVEADLISDRGLHNGPNCLRECIALLNRQLTLTPQSHNSIFATR